MLCRGIRYLDHPCLAQNVSIDWKTEMAARSKVQHMAVVEPYFNSVEQGVNLLGFEEEVFGNNTKSLFDHANVVKHVLLRW